MAKDLLLEIGLEEMPAHVVTPSMKQLEEKQQRFNGQSIDLRCNRDILLPETFGDQSNKCARTSG